MNKITLTLTILMLLSHFSLALAADLNSKQAPTRPMAPPRGSTIPQLKLTPDLLYQEITALKQQNSALNKQVPILNGQVNTLKKQHSSLTQQIQLLIGQVNALRAVIQVSQQGTTIQADNLVLSAGHSLTMTSGKGTTLTVGNDFSLTTGKDLLVKGGKNTTVEGAGTLNLKSQQIKLNDGTKPVAHVTSAVSGGKVISGSNSVFVP